MNSDKSVCSCRPWMMAGIGAATAILVFRTVGALVLLIRSVWPWPPIPTVFPFVHWDDSAHLVVGLLLSIICIYTMGRLIESTSRQARRVILVIVGLLAILPNPMRFTIDKTLVDWPSSPQAPPQSNRRGISLACRLMNGQIAGSQVVITERNVAIARPMAWDDTTYYVELVLDQEGSKKMQTTTSGAVGKNIGFWIDGVLVASPEIIAPLTGHEVVITGNFNLQEAEEISRRLNAWKRGNRGQSEAPG